MQITETVGSSIDATVIVAVPSFLALILHMVSREVDVISTIASSLLTNFNFLLVAFEGVMVPTIEVFSPTNKSIVVLSDLTWVTCTESITWILRYL